MQNCNIMKKCRKLLVGYTKNDYLCITQGMDDGGTILCRPACGMYAGIDQETDVAGMESGNSMF